MTQHAIVHAPPEIQEAKPESVALTVPVWRSTGDHDRLAEIIFELQTKLNTIRLLQFIGEHPPEALVWPCGRSSQATLWAALDGPLEKMSSLLQELAGITRPEQRRPDNGLRSSREIRRKNDPNPAQQLPINPFQQTSY